MKKTNHKIIFIPVFLILSLFLYKTNQVKAFSTNWLYRKPITVNNLGNSLSYYQVLVDMVHATYNNSNLVASWHMNELSKGAKNVVTNTDLDTGWSKGYTQNYIFDDGSPPEGVNCRVVSFENDDTGGTGYWYSYGDYAPQESNTTYTVSLWVKTNQASNVNIKFYTADNNENDRYNSEYRTVNSSEGWKRITWDSFTSGNPTDSDSLSFRYTDLYDGGYTRLWLCGPQMEARDTSTPYVDGTRPGIVKDYSGNNNTGEVYGETETVDGKYGSALKFDGENDYISIPETTLNQSAATIMGYFYINDFEPTDDRANRVMFANNSNTGTCRFIGFQNGSMKFETDVNNVGGGTINSSDIQAGKWFHFALVFDSGVGKMYVNGDYEGQVSLESNSLTINQLGRAAASSSYQSSYPGWFDGRMDEIRIYSRVLSGTEISDIANATKGRLDYGDIRFVDSDESTSLDYWLESDNKAWVEVPSIPDSSKTIYMYYGNPDASIGSNISNTFVFADDFEDGDIDHWTNISSGEVKIYSGNGHNSQYSILKTTNGDPYGGLAGFSPSLYEYELTWWGNRINDSGGGQNRWGIENSLFEGYGPQLTDADSTGNMCIETRDSSITGGNCDVASETGISKSSNTWYEHKFRRYGDGNFVFELFDASGILLQSVSGTDTTYTGPFNKVVIHGGYEFLSDDFRLRKYTSQEPSTFFGSENYNGCPTDGGTIYNICSFGNNFGEDTDYPGNTIRGVHESSGASNVGSFRVCAGASITVQADETLVVGEIDMSGDSGTISIIDGGIIKPGATLWYIDNDNDGYPASTTAKVSETNPGGSYKHISTITDINLVDLDDNDDCTDAYMTHLCGDGDTDGTCSPVSAGENGLPACKRCNGTSIDPVSIANDTQDSEGSNTCNSTCVKCNQGKCVGQAEGEDVFGQCPGGTWSCNGNCQRQRLAASCDGDKIQCEDDSYEIENISTGYICDGGSEVSGVCGYSSYSCDGDCRRQRTEYACNGSNSCSDSVGTQYSNISAGYICDGGSQVSGACNTSYHCTGNDKCQYTCNGSNSCSQDYNCTTCNSTGSCQCSAGVCEGPWDFGTSQINGSWDRNCDGTVEKRWETSGMICAYNSEMGYCIGSDGWYNTKDPDCGVWETWNENCTQCFASGTKIRLINGEEKNIENLKRGEQILAFDENLNLKTAHVTNIIKKIASSYTILITNEGTKVTTTSTHPFLTKNSQFKKVSELKEGDIIYILKNKKLNPERIYQKQEFFQPIQVYNLSVNNPNTFFANSFAVHNKDPINCAYSISEDRQQECR